jgi:hypothetical protein
LLDLNQAPNRNSIPCFLVATPVYGSISAKGHFQT